MSRPFVLGDRHSALAVCSFCLSSGFFPAFLLLSNYIVALSVSTSRFSVHDDRRRKEEKVETIALLEF